MIFQPVLHPLLLVLIFAPVAVVGVIALVRSSSGSGRAADSDRGGHRALWAMRLLMLIACFVMLLRPGIPGGATQTLATDTDIVLVVDTTASIVAEDWNEQAPRLEGVREDVQAIVDEYPGARFALITFDAAAEVRMPLTTDTTALVSSMDVLRPEVTSQSRGSSIGIAGELVAETLGAAAESSPDRSRMVFYFGDGEQTVTSPPESFASSARFTDAGAVFGYGTAEGGPMRLTTGSLGEEGQEYIEYEGENALSVIDEGNLQAVADQLGVPYQHRTADAPPQLPEAPSTTTNYAESGSVGNVTELYWIAALLVLALLAVELGRATMLVARLRRLRPATPAAADVSTRSARSTTDRSLSEERSDETKRRSPAATAGPRPRSVSTRSARSTTDRSLSEERSDETKRRPHSATEAPDPRGGAS